MSNLKSKPLSHMLMLYLEQHPDCSYDDVATWALGWAAAAEYFKSQEFKFVPLADNAKEPATSIIDEAEQFTDLKMQICNLQASNRGLSAQIKNYERIIEETTAQLADSTPSIARLESQKRVLLDYIRKVVEFLSDCNSNNRHFTFEQQLRKLGLEIIERIESNK